MKAKKSLVGAVLLLFATQVCAHAQQGLPPKAVQAGVEAIVLTVTVMNDKGQIVSGLHQRDFSVFENRLPKRLVSFSGQDEPISIGILFDTSSSMGDPRRSSIKRKLQIWNEALAHFLEVSNPSNEYFVLGFNDRPQLALDWTSDHGTVIHALGSLQPRGNTAMYDACYAGIQKVLHGRYRKQSI